MPVCSVAADALINKAIKLGGSQNVQIPPDGIDIDVLKTQAEAIVALTGVKVELAFNPNGKPEAGTDISRRVELLGDLDDAQRQRLLLVANACPIHKVLTGEVRIDTALVT